MKIFDLFIAIHRIHTISFRSLLLFSDLVHIFLYSSCDFLYVNLDFRFMEACQKACPPRLSFVGLHSE